MSIKTILIATTIAGSIFVISPSTYEVNHEMVVHSGSTVNQLVLDAAKAEGINLDSVDMNESRDLTIHNSQIDAGNLKPGTQVKVIVVYRK